MCGRQLGEGQCASPPCYWLLRACRIQRPSAAHAAHFCAQHLEPPRRRTRTPGPVGEQRTQGNARPFWRSNQDGDVLPELLPLGARSNQLGEVARITEMTTSRRGGATRAVAMRRSLANARN